MPPSPTLPWYPISPSPSGAICEVHLLQAGGLTIPKDSVLLPGPNQPNDSTKPDNSKYKAPKFYAPDYVFLIQHLPTGNHYIFDLGMRKDLENLPPLLVKHVLPDYDCSPLSPADILRDHGTPDQQPENVKAVIFSHQHFDHVGDGAQASFSEAELWLGPTTCTYARPGYPLEENSPCLTDTLPTDGTRKIVEAFVSDALLAKAKDPREGKVAKAKEKGLYEAVDFSRPGDDGNAWIGLGAFERGFDVWGDGAAYLLDAPGHSPGHQMMLVRVAVWDENEEDRFVVLAGDCYHHPDLMKDPWRTARPPYSKSSMHADPDQAIDTMFRTKAFAEKDNVWVIGAHDFSVGEAIAPGKKLIEGLVLLNGWKENGWN
ncbi:beta-lactamase-like protein [Clohesyomyces aquaticus]|uniref:Beta-lactamase-like protein n=1 Tax=Clohesyomyces aquaticus TaxID=1231657 RepID=A0A1Y1ZP26_9PLEO|nr:beta-lactamase-like protein [Clohesyomyces aquaticus]